MLLGLATGAPAPITYIEDVFSTYLYTGNASARSITNGIDCSTKKALTWIKERSAVAGSYQHFLFDTVRGAGNYLRTTQTAGQGTDSGMLSAFTSSGFSLGTTAETNVNNGTFVSWTFREAAKFFDVVTWTGDGVAGRQITHSLGTTPGMIIVKRTDTTSNWPVYHRSISSPLNVVYLNLTTAASADSGPFNTAPTSSVFYVGDSTTNANGGTYVAYLFAHDTSADGLIQCGSFTTDGSGNATVSLGWEPQYLMLKASSATDNWRIEDTIRGLSLTGYSTLLANLSNAESSSSNTSKTLTATGFSLTSQSASTTYIYMAIRRGPMKPPTSGTQVFQAVTRTGDLSNNRVLSFNIVPDFFFTQSRIGNVQPEVFDRLRGSGTTGLPTASTGVEGTRPCAVTFGSTTVTITNKTDINEDGTFYSYIDYVFRRYPGVFDQVCYDGDGTNNRALTHGLTVTPELVIAKDRTNAFGWPVWTSALTSTDYNLMLNTSAAQAANSDFSTAGTAFTSTTIRVSQAGGNNNVSGHKYVAYLFATLAGISKVGSYTGNGTSQTIDCGFAAGARFVLIKRTDVVGNWCVFDSTRGIIAGNDPILRLNETGAEYTTYDDIDPAASGFVINQADVGLNASGGTYIYLAFA